jgi:hypothetical protein
MSINSQGWAQIGMAALSVYTGGATGAAGMAGAGGGGLFGAPSSSGSSGFSGGIGSGQDGSGWAVNFRGTQTATSTPTRTTSYSDSVGQMPAQGARQPQPLVTQAGDWQGLPFVAQSGGAMGQNWTWWVLGGLGLLAVWRLKK